MKPLLLNQTTDVTTEATRTFLKADSEFFTAICSGLFDGATVKLQFKGPAGDWVDFPEATWTAPGGVVSPMSQDVAARAVQSGSGASTNITLEIG